MKLLLDIGNQRCKCAAYDGVTMRYYPAVAINDNFKTYIPGDMCDNQSGIESVWISSVQKQVFNRNLSCTVQELLHQSPIFAEVADSVCGFTTRYNRQSLGVDRFLAMVGAWRQFHRTCFVIDCGTAVTIDSLDAQGEHWGGLIMPGLSIMKNSLYQNTARLVLGESKEVLFPQNTADAVDSGCRRLLSAAIAAALSDMRADIDGLCVVTGGDGKWFAQTDKSFIYREALVLEGLAAFAERGV